MAAGLPGGTWRAQRAARRCSHSQPLPLRTLLVLAPCAVVCCSMGVSRLLGLTKHETRNALAAGASYASCVVVGGAAARTAQPGAGVRQVVLIC
jgi:hypothetical protein